MSETEIEEAISVYFSDTLKSIALLYSKDFVGQVLIIMFSTIDAFGLLNASENQENASGKTFKNWVKKYMLNDSRLEYSETDLWASRCATLHTFTTTSKLSAQKKAKEILFYSGSPFDPKAQEFSDFARGLSKEGYVTANLEQTIDAFSSGLKVFARDLDKKCRENSVYHSRLKQIIHGYKWPISNKSSKGML